VIPANRDLGETHDLAVGVLCQEHDSIRTLQLVHFERMTFRWAIWPQRSSQFKPLGLVGVSHSPNLHDWQALLAERCA
jgi:hypothetical protein